MDIYREPILSYLEEDNTQRVYFRVKPFLAPSGDIQEEAKAAWADDGALRIVPDRGEQYHFKDRMRTLGAFCIMDLTHATEEANKIRTNKNYNPSRGERNQYILYSDAVQALPPHSFFEVLEGSAGLAAELAGQAITPLFYIQDGDRLLGPVDRSAVGEVFPAAPAQGTLYPIVCPDGKSRTIFCIPQKMKAETEAEIAAEILPEPIVPPCEPIPVPTPEPEKPAEDEALAIGKTLHILDESKGFDEQLSSISQPLSEGANLLASPAAPTMVPRPARSEPLSGTPLMRSSFRAATPKPKNQLQEVVSAQWRAARYEPPAASLPAGATLHPVDNPVEEACRCLTQAWKLPETQQQLLDHILSLPGIGQRLTVLHSASSGQETTPLQSVLTARLQDLEAERLAALVELDKAKSDVDAFRRSMLDGLQSKKALELKDVEKQLIDCRASVEKMQEQLTLLTAQRDALQAQVDGLQGKELPSVLADVLAKAQLTAPMMDGMPLRMCPVPGKDVEPAELIARFRDGLQNAGAGLSQSDVVTLLTLLACFPRFSLIAPQFASAVDLLKAGFAACGWSSGLRMLESTSQHPIVSSPPTGATPAALVSPLMIPALEAPAHTILVGKTAAFFSRTAAWEMSPWPLWQLPAFPSLSCKIEESDVPISAASLERFAAAESVSDEEISRCLAPVIQAAAPCGAISGSVVASMKRFIRVAAAYMDGGLVDAIDRALALWLGALNISGSKLAVALSEAVSEYPLTSALLNR